MFALTFLFINSISGIDDVIIGLMDNAATWNAGDVIVIASSDYDMNHAERFVLIDCPACSNYQIKIKGKSYLSTFVVCNNHVLVGLKY